MEKLLQLISDIENVEDFIKTCAFNYNIDHQTARELLKQLQKIKERALK